MMTKIKLGILLSLFFLCTAVGYTQNRQIDSLNQLLMKKREPVVLCELARENIIIENLDQALLLGDEALRIASGKGDSLGIVMGHRIRGVVFRRREQMDKALAEILPALEIAKRHNYLIEMKLLLNAMAIIYTAKAQYDRALDCNFQSLVIRELQGDQSEISIALHNIGFTYYKLSNYELALQYYSRSLKLQRKINDHYGEETTLIGIGLSEVYLKNYGDAVHHLKEAFAVCGDHCPDAVKIDGEFGFGAAFFYMGDLGLSRKHFTTSYNIAKKTGNKRFQSENLLFMGRIANRLGDLNEADEYWKQAEVIAGKDGYNLLLLQVYKELYQFYMLRNQRDKVIAYQSKYILLKDSVMSEAVVRNIATIQSHFDERENLKSIKALEENIVLKNEAIARQQLLNIVLGVAAVLLIVTGILIYRLYSIRKKSNEQLDDKVRQRTQQLEEGQMILQGVLQEQHLFMDNLREEMRALMASLHGVSGMDRDMFSEQEYKQMTVGTQPIN